PEGARGLVVALSGGADSAALLSSLATLGAGFRGLPLRAVHIDHGLQAAASGFRQACINLCRQLGVPLQIICVDVPSEAVVSIDGAASDARDAVVAAQL